jgi:hypothetical protein
VRGRVLPGELLKQAAAEPGRALSVHRRDGALDPGGVRVREGGERAVAVAAPLGAVFRIGIVCRIVVARTALVVIWVFHSVPGLCVTHIFVFVYISVTLGLDGRMRQKVRFVPGHPMLKTRRIARRRQSCEMKSRMTDSGAPWCQRSAERDGLRD